MFCPNCGKEVEDGIAFCGSCGKSLQSDQPETSPSTISGVQASATETAKVAAGAVTSVVKRNPKKFMIIGGVVLVVIIALVIAVMMMTGGFTGGQTPASFRSAFEAEKLYAYDVPTTTYVGDSAYELKSCDVTNIEKQSDGRITANINAVAENDDFKITSQYAASYREEASSARAASSSSNGIYSFDLISKELEAKHGVTRDDSADLSNIEAELSEDGKSCEYVSETTDEFWFADSTVMHTNRYELGEYGWSKVSNDDDYVHTVTYKDIDGSYVAKKGSMLDFASFTISDLNAQTGSFNIRIEMPQEVDGYRTYSPTTATLTATIDPERKGGSSAQTDGYQYSFEAKGSTTTGKKNASLKGYFTTDDSGAAIIEITSGSLDRAYTGFGDSLNDTSSSFSGALYKQ